MKERLKTCILLLLCVTALFLALRTWVYDDALVESLDLEHIPLLAWLLDYKPVAEPAHFAPVRWLYTAAATPAHCSVYSNGERRGASSDMAVRTVYEALRVTLGEALNTAGRPAEITSDQWKTLMCMESFYFQYTNPVSLSLLAAWLGGVGSGLEDEITGLGLVFGDENCYLVFMDSGGRYYRAPADVLRSGLPSLPPLPSSLFVFELMDPPPGTPQWMLLTEDIRGLPSVTVTDPPPYPRNMGDYTEFLRLLEIDSISTPSYQGEDMRTYVDGNRSCRLHTDGSLQYSNPEAPGDDSPLYIADSERRTESRVERARALTAALEPLLGDARFTLYRVGEEDGMTVVEFVAAVDGIPFGVPPAYGVVTVGDGLIRRAEYKLARFEKQDETIPLLPPEYAIRLAPGLPLTVSYQPEGGLYKASWSEGN